MDRMAPPLPNLVVGRAIRVMAELTGLAIPENPSSDFWETVLPQQLEEHLTDPDFKAAASFDYVLIDEAQDLLARPRLWECLSQFLTGGFSMGAFALFGDFDNKILADRGAMDKTFASLDASAKLSRWRLVENCRNYQIVGDTAVLLSGFGKPIYAGYMRAGGGIQNYDIFFYEHERAQLDKLGQWLREFKSQGYKPSEITILSFRGPNACAASRLKNEGFKLRPSWQAGECTGYASVHAFKGMENKVVILTDLVLGDPEFHRNLFYTGMTRATESVRVLCDTSCRPTLLGWFTEKADS